MGDFCLLLYTFYVFYIFFGECILLLSENNSFNAHFQFIIETALAKLSNTK